MHSGHRKRIKSKYIKDGADSFEKHELLELLLYYGIPRKNTNEIAHNLINEFGSISAVFDAPINALKKVPGVGDSVAILINLIPQISRIYLNDKFDCKDKVMTKEIIGNTLVNKFIGRKNECVILMLLDSKFKLLYCGTISEGSVNSSDIYIRKIIELAVHYNASLAVISHNHPSGIALPSNNDLKTTIVLKQALKSIGVNLIDHIIVADGDYVSLADSNLDLDNL